MPGIQKHRMMRNTKNDANLQGVNIKGGLFRCVHIRKCDNAPTVIVRIKNMTLLTILSNFFFRCGILSQ